MKNRRMKIEKLGGVLFDFDGTLTKPGVIDFLQIKRKIECPKDTPILEFLETCSTENRKKAEKLLNEYEDQAAKNSYPNEYAEELLSFLRQKNIPFGIITRNSFSSVLSALNNFQHFDTPDAFKVIVTRDAPVKRKPHPEGILSACKQMGLEPEKVFVVGDYVFDIQAGNSAGCTTVFLTNGSNIDSAVKSDFITKDLKGIKKLLKDFIPLGSGKVPNTLLKKYLEKYAAVSDKSLIVNPGIGEDVAVVPLDKYDCLILKSDPITIASEKAGYYAVTVNLNDLATAGGEPKWFLTSIFFPENTVPKEIESVFEDISEACKNNNVILVGGHTEITPSVTVPVISGMMAGFPYKKILRKDSMEEGDDIIVTKGIAVEGTSILASDFSSVLREKGIPEKEIEEGRSYINQISILKEARIARNYREIRAMHDVTEGGIATALRELSTAGNHILEIDEDTIPVLSRTDSICARLNLDPRGLIGSGSLIIVIGNSESSLLVKDLKENEIEASIIGKVRENGVGLDVFDSKGPKEWPEFEADEITKMY
jgi:hydrogenase expression/formation protein HypE